MAGAKLSSEGGIVQCSVIGWRDDACRLRKAVPKCLGTGAECQSVFRHFGTGAEVSWGQSVLGPKCLVTNKKCPTADGRPAISVSHAVRTTTPVGNLGDYEGGTGVTRLPRRLDGDDPVARCPCPIQC